MVREELSLCSGSESGSWQFNMARRIFALSLVILLAQRAWSGQVPVMQLNDGNIIPTVALGTGRATAPDRSDVEEVRHAVLWALETGYRHIDTAAIYNDEKEVGQGIADAIAKGVVKREDIFVTTKLWNNRHAKEQVVPALRESLEKLGLGCVELYLIHFPVAQNDDDSPSNIDYLETWAGMEEAKKLGLAKSIGVSNFNVEQLDRLVANSNIKPAVNQIEVNPTLTQHELVEHTKSLGIAVMAYSPFGFVVGRSKPDAPPPRVDDPVLVAMANKYGKTTTQVVLRYLIERGTIPIPKSVNKKRLAQNIDLFDFKLTPAEIESIDKFNKNVSVFD